MEIIYLLIVLFMIFVGTGLMRWKENNRARGHRPEKEIYWTFKFLNITQHRVLNTIAWTFTCIATLMFVVNIFAEGGIENKESIKVANYKWEYMGETEIMENNGVTLKYYFPSPEGIQPANKIIGNSKAVGNPVHIYKGYRQSFFGINNLFVQVPVYYYTTKKDDYLTLVNRSYKPEKKEQ